MDGVRLIGQSKKVEEVGQSVLRLGVTVRCVGVLRRHRGRRRRRVR